MPLGIITLEPPVAVMQTVKMTCTDRGMIVVRISDVNALKVGLGLNA